MGQAKGGITRREMLHTAGSLAGIAAIRPVAASADDANPRIDLRVLETSDLHMFVLDWDYYHVKTDPTVGFAKVASLIRSARAESANTLLFDNGDFLQGNPLADFIAEGPRPSAATPHPIVAIMGSAGYDAVGLGNHEFNYGLDFLEASLTGAPFPFVCANATRADGSQFLPPHAVLERRFKDTSGAEHTLKIGVIGFVPPQIMIWDKARLEGKLATTDIVLAAKKFVPALRAKCDLLVALCHSGISAGAWTEGAENASLHLASVPGIDLIFTGHSHRVFPGKDYEGIDGIDAAAGRLNGVPAIMPGFWGSHLGVADLTLVRKGERWSIAKAIVETRSIYKRDGGKIEELAPRDASVAAAIAKTHEATLAWVEQPVGVLESPVHSYLVWAGYDPASALVNAAQTWYARPLLAGTPHAGLALLSSVATFRVGYTPDSFIDIPAGNIALRQVADLYYYSNNTLTAVTVTGAQLMEWLEFSARIFNTIDPAAAAAQALIDTKTPSYNFDVISGVTYKIDVSKPARYDSKGVLNAGTRRISDLRFNGATLDPVRQFVVLTNNYRADGGGNFPALKGATIVLRAPDTNRDTILRYLKATPSVAVPKSFPWTFAAIGQPTKVYFDTGKQAAVHLAEAGVPSLAISGDGEPGFARVAMTLA